MDRCSEGRTDEAAVNNDYSNIVGYLLRDINGNLVVTFGTMESYIREGGLPMDYKEGK